MRIFCPPDWFTVCDLRWCPTGWVFICQKWFDLQGNTLPLSYWHCWKDSLFQMSRLLLGEPRRSCGFCGLYTVCSAIIRLLIVKALYNFWKIIFITYTLHTYLERWLVLRLGCSASLEQMQTQVHGTSSTRRQSCLIKWPYCTYMDQYCCQNEAIPRIAKTNRHEIPLDHVCWL
jgi:hypothetical protein